ncbi:hypothetical protein CEXT_311251 [Caerostris extrusa]|uniref:Uncharacterized protein n=1 Tax=Caerostris extrusa TaxID=172846 RepID=A0AAV4S5T5_CAEEX|nr:hypothetical protein CEXT_311251 [Caerostris extrusa]
MLIPTLERSLLEDSIILYYYQRFGATILEDSTILRYYQPWRATMLKDSTILYYYQRWRATILEYSKSYITSNVGEPSRHDGKSLRLSNEMPPMTIRWKVKMDGSRNDKLFFPCHLMN